MQGEGYKRCGACGETKPLAEFHRDRARHDGLKSTCKPCRRAQAIAYSRALGSKPRVHATVCKRGHDLTDPANLRPSKGPGNCAVCHRERARERYAENPEKMRREASEYQRKNRAARRAYHKRWRTDNEAYRIYMRDRMRLRSMGKDEVAFAFSEILRCDPCAYCGGPAGHVDHIEPLSAGGPNTWDNLTATCLSCNSSKRTRPLLTALTWIGDHR